MKRLSLLLGAALLLASATAAVGAGHGGMGGAMAAPMARPAATAGAPTSATTMSGPTNPNTRSGNAFGHPGSPSVSCQSIGAFPGDASSSPGSPFNEPTATSQGGNAGLHYAGNAPQNSKNTASVAQYDVACANQASH